MIKIHIKYFAALKEQAQKLEETIEFNGKTPRELWEKLVKLHGFTPELEHLKVAINHEFASFESEIQENDVVVFIPPVAGG